MLSSGLVWRRRLAALLVFAVAVVLIAIAGLRVFTGDSSSSSGAAARSAVAEPKPGDQPGGESAQVSAEMARFERALKRGVAEASALGGSVEAATMVDGWRDPLVESSVPGGESRYMRMWSMSKVATMIALLRERGWGAQLGRATSLEVDEALHGAIVRSENCRQRRVVLELEHFAGGAGGARAALGDVLRDAGAEARIGSLVEAPESLCIPYLETQVETPDPLAPALLLGTSTWRVSDAVRFMNALASDAYGEILSDRVLDLMRAPKLPSREVAEGELTAPLDWGAGSAFAGLDPAYKAGWGGVLNGDFMAGQIALVTLPNGRRLSVAAMFHPDAQPSRDDPGITAAPRAIEMVMRSLREAAPG